MLFSSIRAPESGALRVSGRTLKLMEILYGLHPVEEALKAGKRRFDHVLIARERRDARL